MTKAVEAMAMEAAMAATPGVVAVTKVVVGMVMEAAGAVERVVVVMAMEAVEAAEKVVVVIAMEVVAAAAV